MVQTHTTPIAPGELVATADQRVVMYGVPWSHYETQLALRGDAPVPRMAYLDGVLELMSPSKDHERIKSYLGRLVEAFADERGIALSPYGAWTLKSARHKIGVEPDECYILGPDQNRDRPDLAIEVIWTSGGLEKLAIYQSLGVGEVWFWIDSRIDVHVLHGTAYVLQRHSNCLAGLDLALVCSLLDYPTMQDAVRALRDALRPTAP